ncbi:hypothetical protein BH23CHL5_BH23CHL5_27750 [soil metagenome]
MLSPQDPGAPAPIPAGDQRVIEQRATANLAAIAGVLIIGIGGGTLLTLMFNLLVSASPKHLAGDVGALRGVANNVSSALGSTFAGVVAVGLLGVLIVSTFNQSDLPAELQTEISFDRIDFVSNIQLESFLTAETSDTDEQVAEPDRSTGSRMRSYSASR